MLVSNEGTRVRSWWFVTAGAALALVACGRGGGDVGVSPTDAVALEVTSSAFEDGGTVPERFSCLGEDVSPPLSWSGVPGDARSIVITLRDPDAPGGTFVHWLVALPGDVRSLDAGRVPEGAVLGTTDFGEPGYAGPCPPEGDSPHRYVFTVHALDRALDLREGFSGEDLEDAMEGHVVAQGTVTPTFGR